jgi:amidase
MSNADEFSGYDAITQAELVRQGEVTPLELVDAAINRIEQINPRLNAVVTPMYDLAREVAQKPLPDGPFKGVPYLLKDLTATYQGVRHTTGSVVLKDFVADHDTELVRRLKQAGLIIVGITNSPEFGCHVTTEPRLFGPTHNPWNTDHSSGGSSGGSAAAVAAGLVPAAHATDGGGSIRIPASCCGLFGLKPTRARTSLAPDLGDIASGIVNEHAVTRTVRDSAALLDTTAGPAPGDPYYAPLPARPFLQEVNADPGQLRIGFTSRTLSGEKVHPDCVQAVLETSQYCAALGHIVEEATPSINGEMFFTAFETVFSSVIAWNIDTIARLTGQTFTADHFDPLTGFIYQAGQQCSASDYLSAVAVFQHLGRVMADFFGTYDLWLTPTLAEPPVRLGAFDFSPEKSPEESVQRVWSYIPFTPICNATGLPAMTIPLCWNDAGLPVGTHFVGRFGDEATLLRLAGQLEEAYPWAHRKPPVSA